MSRNRPITFPSNRIRPTHVCPASRDVPALDHLFINGRCLMCNALRPAMPVPTPTPEPTETQTLLIFDDANGDVHGHR